MRYLAFPGKMMTLSKHQDWYLNQQVILFGLQYKTHSLQRHPESLCRYVVALTPKLLEQRYALRMVVVPCRYFPSLSPFFQPISPSLLSQISFAALPHLLHLSIHACCYASPPPFSSAAVFTADLDCHPYYPASPARLHCYPNASLFHSLSHYLPSFCVLSRRCLSTFSNWIFSLLYVVLHYTAFSALIHTTFLNLRSYLLTKLFFYLLVRLLSLSVMFSLCSDILRFFLHLPSLRSSPI